MKTSTVNKLFYFFEALCVIGILFSPDSHTTTSSTTASGNPTRATVIITQDPSTESRWFWQKGNPKMPDNNHKLADNCTGIVQGARCALRKICAPAPAPATLDGGSTHEGEATACMDKEGRARSNAAVNAEHLKNAGIGLHPCAGGAPITTGPEWCWWLWRVYVHGFLLYATIEWFYTASLPLVYANKGHRPYETLTYSERLQAVISLWLVTGGGPLLFFITEVYMLHGIWELRGTLEVLPLEALFLVWSYITMRFPLDTVMKHWCVKLWIRYFDLKVKSEFAEALAKEEAAARNKREKRKQKRKGKTYMLAQMPHGVMPFGALLGASVLDEALPGVDPVSGVVATALLWTPVLRHLIHYFGVREAGSPMIHEMFADGYEAVAVVAGGIAEMFVSKETEILSKIRKNFARAALVGGRDIVIVFGFGVSRTLQLWPCFDNRFTRALSRKIKLPAVFYGGVSVFGLVPRRQQLKLVVSRPIEVKKAVGEVTDEQALELCEEVQAEVVKLYKRHKPFWETRPILYIS